jgi:hypothetical protein
MAGLLGEVYDAFTALVSEASHDELERPARTAAWSVRQLLFHQLLDAQRALVALASPTGAEPDVDEATYWRPFRPSEGDGGAAHARFVVRAADAYESPRGLVEHWASTSAAAARAAAAAPSDGRVETQGHVIAVPDLVSTLVVEATVHLLDAWGDPPAGALTHTRRVLELIDGGPLSGGADDIKAILLATGRLPSDHPSYPLLG